MIARTPELGSRRRWYGHVVTVGDGKALGARVLDRAASFPGVVLGPHRFGGTEIRFGRAEVGHVHVDGTVDVPLLRRERDELVRSGTAEAHRFVPDSGWVTVRLVSEPDVERAVSILRRSYERRVETSERRSQRAGKERPQLGVAPRAGVRDGLPLAADDPLEANREAAGA